MMDDRTWADNKLLREMAIAEENERKAVTTAPQFGEPWTYERHPTNGGYIMVAADGLTIAYHGISGDYMPREARAIACVNAMANIADPQAFVREVRELLKECMQHHSEDLIEWDHPYGQGHCTHCGGRCEAGCEEEINPMCVTCERWTKLSAMLARLDAGKAAPQTATEAAIAESKDTMLTELLTRCAKCIEGYPPELNGACRFCCGQMDDSGNTVHTEDCYLVETQKRLSEAMDAGRG